jgi:hypothetical protein
MSLPAIRSMSPAQVGDVRRLESAVRELPQVEIDTQHVIHAGAYSRTIRIPAGVILTGAEIKRSTLLVFNGRALVTMGDETVELSGYHVLPAAAGRKQAFLALADTDLTMVFATGAGSVEEAESEFTDEPHLLMSRKPGARNYINITGE